MTLIDTHSHLYCEEFDEDRDLAVERAREAGITHLLLPAIDSLSHARLIDMCRRYGDLCRPMMGLHPTSVNELPDWRGELDAVERYLETPPDGIGDFCAVGEIGLDFYWSRDFMKEQEEAFRRQLDLSLRHRLPVAIHTREAWERTAEIIGQYRGRGLRGVFHAFSDTVERYRELKASGDFLFGIGGVVTFKKSSVADVVREMSLDDMVLETDCPYLTPVPYRGQRNESAYVVHVCRKIAELKGVDEEEVAHRTSLNAARMFDL